MKALVSLLIPALLISTLPVLAADSDRLIRRANRYFAPLPDAMPGSANDSVEKIALGEKLYFDNRLSRNDDLSCASCHKLENGQALTQAEQEGLNTFIKADCTSRHDGVLLGGESLETMGKKQSYSNQGDLGLYHITQNESDRMVFKVSQLRNIALTGPYFHDAKVTNLEETIRLGTLQLDNKLSDQDETEIITFLITLTDKSRKK